MESSRETEVTVTALFLLAALLAVVLAYCAASIIIMRAGCSTPPQDLEYLIVLGAMVRPDGLPTRALHYRLEAALSYLAEHPTTIAIVSGGQGADEPVSEAAAMACWLADRGVGSERIIQESASTTTAENLSLSAQLVPGLRKRRVGIVTNDFHLYRSLLIARKQGFQRVWGVPAASTPENLPVNLARECFALIKTASRATSKPSQPPGARSLMPSWGHSKHVFNFWALHRHLSEYMSIEAHRNHR